jgi:hypothetical protein
VRHSGLRGGSLQVVKAGRGATRVAGNSEGDVGLHSAAAWLCASLPVSGQQIGAAPMCMGTACLGTCRTSHMGGDVNRGPPCWQLAHCCWRTCSMPHLAVAAGHGKATAIAVAPLDLVNKVVDGAAGDVGKDLVQVEDGGDVCAAHTTAFDGAGGLCY